MRIQRGSLRETISNLRKLNTIWMEILRISFECISDFHKILKNLMRNLRTPLGNWRESLQFDDNSKRILMVHWEKLKGIPFKIDANLKRMLMVPFENWRGSPSKSKRIQRGNLRESIGNLRKLNTIWIDIIRNSFGGQGEVPRHLSSLRILCQFEENSWGIFWKAEGNLRPFDERAWAFL